MAESTKVREEQQPVTSIHEPEATTAAVVCETVSTKAEPSSSTPAEPEMKLPELSEVVLHRLARQAEYYFSAANLSKDTYVSTLRSLNDGYVPISIIANFGKVKSLVPYDGFNAVRKAATEFSELLEIVEINTQTGKRVSETETHNNDTAEPPSTLEAVGPIGGQPIPLSKIAASPASSPATVKSVTSIQNTVIIREVPRSTEEAHVRELFTFESCPAIQSMHLDVANCWFITLDTSSRDDIINVMFELRKKKFASGEPVLARLKSGVVMNSDSSANIGGFYPSQPSSPNRYHNNGGRKNKKKKNSPNKSTKVPAAGNNNQITTSGNNNQNKNGKAKNNNNSINTNSNRRNNNGTKQKKANGQEKQIKQEPPRSPNSVPKQTAPSQQAPPPSALGEEQFPALPTEDAITNSNKFEVEKVPDQRPEDDYERHHANSDSASTATTSSSSSSSKQTLPIGGYAAALLKSAPPQLESRPVVAAAKKVNEKSKKEPSSKVNSSEPPSQAPRQVVTIEATESLQQPVNVQPPSWGRGRSFADVLRKETAAVVAAEQTA